MAAPKHLQGFLGREVFRFPAGICFFSAGNQGLGVTGEGGSHIDRWEGIKGRLPPWRGLSGEIQAGCNAAFFRLCIPMQAAGASPFPPRRSKLVGLPVKAGFLLHEPLIFQVFAFCKVQWITSLQFGVCLKSSKSYQLLFYLAFQYKFLKVGMNLSEL